MSIKKIKITGIRIDGGTQSRAELNQATVSEYAEAMTDGAKFPPVVVFFDGADHWLADGFHRYFGTKQIGALDIDADVREGTKRDAILFSLGANAIHGLRRSNADKRKAVETLLNDTEWSKWSDRKIAEACGVGAPLVGGVRKAICNPITDAHAIRKVERAGKTYEQDTTNIGKSKAPQGESDSTTKVEQVEPKLAAQLALRRVPAAIPELPVEPTAEDGDDHHQSIEEVFAGMENEIQELRAQLAALEADDTKAELRKALLQRDHAVRQQSEAMDKAHREQKAHAFKHRQLMRCGKAVGENDPDRIAPAVEAFVRANRRAA